MDAIQVSPEMVTLIGSGAVGEHGWPPEPVAFAIDDRLSMTFHAAPDRALLDRAGSSSRVLLIVARSACEWLFGGPLALEDGASYRLPAELRAIAIALRDCTMSEAAALPYRLAKSIELVCEILRASGEGSLFAAALGSLSLSDCRRIAAARELIDERWDKPLTLSDIARHCGLNRSKLSRGFRDLYQCSVSEALAERRLGEARRQLIATDLPVGLIGYRSGYQNNASFSRAFCRRFGVPPSGLRPKAMAI